MESAGIPGGPEWVGGVNEKMRGFDSRISSLHGRVGEVQVQMADVKVIKREVEETKEDLQDFKEEFGRVTKEMRDNFDKKFETLTSAARWGTGTMIAALGVLVTILVRSGVA
jgi:hypothetical protein